MNVKHTAALGSLQSSHCVTVHLGLFILSFQFISLHNNDPKEGRHFANTIWLNFDEGFESLWQMGAFCMAACKGGGAGGDEKSRTEHAWPVLCPEGLYTWADTRMKSLAILKLDDGGEDYREW